MQKPNIFFYFVILSFIIISCLALFLENAFDVSLPSAVSDVSSIKVLDEFVQPKLSDKEDNSIELILVGDIMLGRTVMGRSYEEGDFLYPFRKIAAGINDSDIVFANLENPVIEDCSFTEKSLIFCSTPEMLEGLNFSGVNVVNLSNNHTGNYGNKGIKETIEHLNDANISYTGVGELLINEDKGVRLGFLGFNYTFGNSAELVERDLKLIKSSDQKVDYLIVGVHWGQEYTEKPNSFQKEMAQKMINSGADIISGHHPHWIQTMEIIDGKLVYYSLGNFVFDQMWSEETRTGLIVRLSVDKDGIKELEQKRIFMESWAQPQLID